MGEGLGAEDQQSGHQDPLTSSPITRPRNVDDLKAAARAASRLYSVCVTVYIVLSVCACNRRDISMGIHFTSAFLVRPSLTNTGLNYQVKHSVIPRSAHTVYLCVLCGSQNKQRLFPYTTLTAWFV